MRREIIINASPSETRIAILEDKELVEVMVERPEAVRRVGDIYKGRVNAVLPGMQAAFVDLGLEKSAFLHASDLMPDDSEFEDEDDEEDGEDRRRGGGGRGRRDEQAPRIEDALKKGQEVLVLIT
jgi:ribonuclease G